MVSPVNVDWEYRQLLPQLKKSNITHALVDIADTIVVIIRIVVAIT